MYLKRQKFLVFGVSRSGVAAAELLLKKGASVYFYEEYDNEKIRAAADALSEMGAIKVRESEIDEIINKIDVIVLSPGVPINHSIPVKARRLGKRITGELELASTFIKTPIIAVTGTNGKTTTSTMISKILTEGGVKNELVGNIGTPVSSKLKEIEESEAAVTEVSSFQLETVHSFTPHIACVLNVTPDHLERHYTFDNYVFLKKRILKNMRESEIAILNYDDETVRSFAEGLKAKTVFVSLKQVIDGAYRENGTLFYKGEPILNETELNLNGEHNVQNALFSIAVAKEMGVKSDAIISALSGFKGIRHRLELVDTINGISYYNDSKSTNTDSAINAVRSMKKPTVIILGGSDKGEDFTDLFKEIKNSEVTHAVLVGATKNKLLSSAVETGFDRVTVTDGFENAVKIATALCERNGNVLLSPACASFDEFENYKKRGEKFCIVVEAMK